MYEVMSRYNYGPLISLLLSPSALSVIDYDSDINFLEGWIFACHGI